MMSALKTFTSALAGLAFSAVALLAQAEPLKIGYSDWPGWVAWEVGIEKGWFKEAGVEVKFEWFDYVASMDAFAAGDKYFFSFHKYFNQFKKCFSNITIKINLSSFTNFGELNFINSKTKRGKPTVNCNALPCNV